MSVILRDFTLSDIYPIDEIFRRQPEIGVPGFKNMISNSTLVDSTTNKVVGYGILKAFSEGILILDKSIRKRDKAEAVKLAVERAILESKRNNVEYLYFLTSNPSFADVLRKRFKFRTVNEEVLKLDLDPNEA